MVDRCGSRPTNDSGVQVLRVISSRKSTRVDRRRLRPSLDNGDRETRARVESETRGDASE